MIFVFMHCNNYALGAEQVGINGSFVSYLTDAINCLNVKSLYEVDEINRHVPTHLKNNPQHDKAYVFKVEVMEHSRELPYNM